MEAGITRRGKNVKMEAGIKRGEERNDGARNHEGGNVTMEAGITRREERNEGGRNHEGGRT